MLYCTPNKERPLVERWTQLEKTASKRARPGFEPGTSRTRSENHTPRPTSHPRLRVETTLNAVSRKATDPLELGRSAKRTLGFSLPKPGSKQELLEFFSNSLQTNEPPYCRADCTTGKEMFPVLNVQEERATCFTALLIKKDHLWNDGRNSRKTASKRARPGFEPGTSRTEARIIPLDNEPSRD
ncbi:hypothetical protein QQF64_003188 [Cirrhinus molitorella]|uniref:Uncharacterized protein n=1 Tax=Cirrhinus molitorella TaxID=172907 RepID=A0ABR3MJA7_9TELE